MASDILADRWQWRAVNDDIAAAGPCEPCREVAAEQKRRWAAEAARLAAEERDRKARYRRMFAILRELNLPDPDKWVFWCALGTCPACGKETVFATWNNRADYQKGMYWPRWMKWDKASRSVSNICLRCRAEIDHDVIHEPVGPLRWWS